MKVEAKFINAREFEPVELKLNIVNQKEFDAIYFLFNVSTLCRVVEEYSGISCNDIRSKIDKVGNYTPDEFDMLFKKLKQGIKEII